MKVISITLLAIFCFLAVVSARATEDSTQIGRYMTAQDGPKPEQLDLLKQEMQVKFPDSVKTIGDAMNYLLQYSGYSLVPSDIQSDALKKTLNKPLPTIDRSFGPMKLDEGLKVLAGPVFDLVQDPLNRVVDFKLKPAYSKLYEKKTPSPGANNGAQMKSATTKLDASTESKASENILAQSFSKAAQALK